MSAEISLQPIIIPKSMVQYMKEAAQKEWDNAFIGLVPYQIAILPEMKYEYSFINLALIDRGIKAQK